MSKNYAKYDTNLEVGKKRNVRELAGEERMKDTQSARGAHIDLDHIVYI